MSTQETSKIMSNIGSLSKTGFSLLIRLHTLSNISTLCYVL